jgi:four helix bundle protein
MLALFRATETFPDAGSYELASQIRHDCLSIAANIAKGYDKLAKAKMVDCFKSALSSASDLESQVVAACYRGFLSGQYCDTLVHEITIVKRMLTAFIH